MKRNWLDIRKGFILWLLKPFVYIWMRFDQKRYVKRDENVDFKRKEPFVLLANHTFLFDIIHVPLRFRRVPYIVGSQTLFTKQPTKFLVTKIARVIPKSKGKSDVMTVKGLIRAVRSGYPVLIFPEGDTTFYGKTNPIETSTYKLVKTLGVDVLTCRVKGGYLSKPRWATGKRKRRAIELDYNMAISKDELVRLSLEEVAARIKNNLTHDDYAYQKVVMRPHPGRKLAEGIENVVYVCPHCEAINSIVSKGNTFHCEACGKEGKIDRYGFIQNFVYTNLVDWDDFQRSRKDRLDRSSFRTTGTLYDMRVEDQNQHLIGPISIRYADHVLYIRGSIELDIPIEDLSNATITLRRDFGFNYQGRMLLIKVDRYGASLLRVVQTKY
jgi:1-acyl-sn-glycerol-3-phosphate acyltransferase